MMTFIVKFLSTHVKNSAMRAKSFKNIRFIAGLEKCHF